MKKQIMGWREWCSLPDLGIPAIKAKIDTGAKSTALHATSIVIQHDMVSFVLNPIQKHHHVTRFCNVKLQGIKSIRNSGGILEHRYVIRTPIMMDDQQWDIDITLTDRHQMGFRLLIGRDAIKHKFIVDPSKFLLLNTWTDQDVLGMYK
jgi:ribosomal protein S6--L-glutamate ligase